ncbi:DUF1534 domain-containing protein [Pseudomonas sp. SZ57]|nr:DUF1534 domain-containing protein [Pseudomonas sp. SZ57]
MGTRMFSRTPIVPTLQRGNAFRDAPRHTVLRFSDIQARLESSMSGRNTIVHKSAFLSRWH